MVKDGFIAGDNGSLKLSVMLFPFYGQLNRKSITPLELINSFYSLGIRAVEPSMRWIKANRAAWRRIHAIIADFGMRYSCCDIVANLVGRNEKENKKTLDEVEKNVEFVKKNLNCSLVLVAGARPAEGMSNEYGRKVYGAQLARLCEKLEKTGVTITMESYGMYPDFVAGIKHCRKVIACCGNDNLKFTFDNGNFVLGGDSPLSAYHRFKKIIEHVHIKDFCRCARSFPAALKSMDGKTYRTCLIGEGEAEASGCVRLLKHDKYPGWISLEVGVEGNPLAEVIRGVNLIKNNWREC